MGSIDPSLTAPFDLGTPSGAPCLLLHGFTGSPWDMRPLGDALAKQGFSARGIRLPGHGTTPEALLGVRAEDWLQASEDALIRLGTRPVRVVGLSMGALIAVWLAAKHPSRVRALALLAPAVRFQAGALAWAKRLRRLPLMEMLRPWVPKTATDIQDPKVLAQAPILPAFPSARLRDLWRIQEVSRSAWNDVRAPALVAFASNDHVVSAEGARELARGLVASHVRFIEIQKGCHIIPRDLGAKVMEAEVLDFFAKV